jgi:hypothetical protein
MILRSRPRAWTLALGLAVLGWAAGSAQAAPITYATVGSVDTPAGGLPGLVYYNGISHGTVTPPDSIDLGQFVVSSLAKTTNATYANTPFQIIASVGGDASERISGVLNGSVGPSAGTPSLTATITSISQYGNSPLPFSLNLPVNTPMKICLSNGTDPAPTSLTGATTVPEPTSIAVFTVTLGGLGVWRRRRAAR